MIKSTQNNLINEMKIGYNDLHVDDNDLVYNHIEIPKVFYDLIKYKDPMTIYYVVDEQGHYLKYLGDQLISNYEKPVKVKINENAYTALFQYIKFLTVNYTYNSLDLPPTLEKSVMDMMLTIIGLGNKYDICDGSNIRQRLYTIINSVFTYYDAHDLINKKHTEEDIDEFGIINLISTLINTILRDPIMKK